MSGVQLGLRPNAAQFGLLVGLNALVGMRFFVTPYTALFTEYKYSEADLAFDNAFSPAQGFASGGFSGTYRAQHIVVGILYHF